MKLILRDEIEGLGYAGDVVTVKDGYGRNFLLPRGLAILATAGAIRDLERRQRSIDLAEMKRRGEFVDLADSLKDKVVTIEKRAGSGLKLYGSVTTADIAQALKEQHGLEIERKHLALAAPVKTLGMHEVTVNVATGVDAQLQIEVVREGAEEEEGEADKVEATTQDVIAAAATAGLAPEPILQAAAEVVDSIEAPVVEPAPEPEPEVAAEPEPEPEPEPEATEQPETAEDEEDETA